MESPPFYLILILILAGWCALSLLISRISGWRRISRHYRSTGTPQGVKLRFQSLGGRYATSYTGCINVVLTRQGLHLSVLFLFRVGHPPLSIPWTDISASEKRSPLFRGYILRLARCPDLPLLVTQRLAKRISDFLGESSPFPGVD
jgi:hypothetical protein